MKESIIKENEKENRNQKTTNYTYRFERPHGEEVGHHGAEARGQTGLGDEAELELRQADDVVPLLPVPAGDVEQVGLQLELCQVLPKFLSYFPDVEFCRPKI